MDSRKRKTWSDHELGSLEYLTGLTKFVKYAFEKTPSEDRTIACPCSGCVRYHRYNEKDVYDHLVIKGPMRDFEKWYDDYDCDFTPLTRQDDQWLKLLSYWDQEKTKRRAIINKNNQKNQTMPHCSGRQSFAQLRAKETVNGVEPSRAKFFLLTHKDRKTRDKKKIDEDSAKAAELMKEKLQELPNGVENTDGQIAWKGDIFDQVIGKEERGGRVRGVGGGVCATKLWGQSNTTTSQNFMENGESSNVIVEQLRDDMKHMQERHDEEMRQLQEKRDMELKEMRDAHNRLESNISQLLNLFTQRTTMRNSSRAVNENDISNRSG